MPAQRGVDTRVIHLDPEEHAYLRQVGGEEGQVRIAQGLDTVTAFYRANHKGKQKGAPGSSYGPPTVHASVAAYDVLIEVCNNIAKTERRRRVSMGEAVRAVCQFHQSKQGT